MKPTQSQIEEIADELDSSMRCFFHLKTGKLISFPDFDEALGADEELFEEESKEIEEHWDEYFEFERLFSNVTKSWRILPNKSKMPNYRKHW